MLVNSANLDSLRVGFKTSSQRGQSLAPSQYLRIATVVPSTSKEEKYGWLGQAPKVREWIGPRAVQNLQQYDYSIKNKLFELTIGVQREDIDDDNLGIYAPLFEEMGRSLYLSASRRHQLCAAEGRVQHQLLRRAILSITIIRCSTRMACPCRSPIPTAAP